MNATSHAYRGLRVQTALGFTGVLLLAGCASTPPVPTANLQAAQQAIAAAERSEASRYAPGELSEAHTKLAAADSAVTEKRMGVAERLADQSRAEAELASARTSSAKANAVNDEMRRGNGTLIDEMKRGSGDKQ
jgi:type IV pilus biogenesis protein CpaD/CtpE